MKRPLAMLLCLVLMPSLYAACSVNREKPADDAPSVSFTRSNMPRLDGSTSTVPLALAMCAELLGENREDPPPTLSPSSRRGTLYADVRKTASDMRQTENYKTEKQHCEE